MTDPPWRGSDLGHPLPDSPYAVSVALPLWSQVVGYEEGEPDVLERLQAGYPRFFVPRAVRDLETLASRELELSADERCSIYPSDASAGRCVRYIQERADGWPVDVRPVFGGEARAVVFPDKITSIGADYWRYCGEGISGRRATRLIAGRPYDSRLGDEAKGALREVIAGHTGQDSDDVHLFPSGMAAVAAIQRALSSLAPNARSVQFDFPYVDVLRVQREFGAGVAFFPDADADAMRSLRELMSSGERLSGVFCEIPSNPLLRSVDLGAISPALREHGVPLVVDDTVASNQNVDVFAHADLVTTSLTKYYSGVGDVLAGAVTVNGKSPLAPALREALLADERCDGLWGEDASVLLENCQDYPDRMSRVNETTPQLVDWLGSHPAVERVWYSSLDTRAEYDAVRRSGGGYSGLFSIVLRDAARASAPFYDALQLCKGPSLGTNFTIVCPYTLLAHYQELDWCENHGVSRWLIRVSVGLEGFTAIKERFEAAFAKIC